MVNPRSRQDSDRRRRTVLAGPTIRRRRLGTDLRRLREARSLKLEEVAAHLGIAPSTLSRIETGKAPTRTSYLSVMLDLYEIDDPVQRKLLADHAREGQRKGWWADYDDLLPVGAGTYLGLEAEASALRAFGADVVHELLQTEDYARAATAASRPELPAADVDRLVVVTRSRQQVLADAAQVQFRLILDEAVLLRSVGPAALMRAQLAYLLDAAGRPNVTVQVLRLLAAERLVLTGSFAIVSFCEPGDEDVLCTPSPRGQVLLDERYADVHAMRLMFDALSLSAMSPPASANLIRELAGQV
jgi:transcriptional regulator with XRE-family HTH domain